jgi:mannosyltransferase
MNQEIDFEELAPWLVLLITLVGGVLRLIMLDFRGMGLDETLSVWLSSYSVSDILQWVVRIDQHPPLYYILLHFWMGLAGNKSYDARFLSVLFSTGTIPIIYLIGKRLAGLQSRLLYGSKGDHPANARIPFELNQDG